MVDSNFIWTIVNLVLALLLSITSVFSFTTNVGNDFKHIFLILLDVIIILIPICPAIHPYFRFLTYGVGAPILLIIISCFIFNSITSFCAGVSASSWTGCYSDCVALLVVIVCGVQMFFRNSDLNGLKQTFRVEKRVKGEVDEEKTQEVVQETVEEKVQIADPKKKEKGKKMFSFGKKAKKEEVVVVEEKEKEEISIAEEQKEELVE